VKASLFHKRLPFVILGLVAIFVSFLPAQESKENADFKLAVGLYNDGMFDLAVEQLKSFIAAYPATSQGIEARFTLGLSQLKLERFEDARATFQNFALGYSDNAKAPEAWIHVGEAFQGLKNEREAASAFERIKVFHPKNSLASEGLLIAGTIYRHIGDRDAAKRVLRAIIQEYPASKQISEARLAMGEIYTEEGQTILAEQEIRRVSESTAPREIKTRALLALGRIQIAECVFDQAESTLTNLVHQYPQSAASIPATFELGKLAMSAHDFASAINRLKSVAMEGSIEESLRAEAQYTLGNAYLERRDYENVALVLERLTETFPSFRFAAEARVRAGTASLAAGKPKDALRLVQPILSDSSPIKREALIVAARASIIFEHYQDAVRYFSAALNGFPDDPLAASVFFSLAQLYEQKLHNYRQAAFVYRQLAERFPRTPEATRALIRAASCEEQLGDFQDAVSSYTALLQQYPAIDSFTTLQQRIDSLQTYAVKNHKEAVERMARIMGEAIGQKPGAKTLLELGRISFEELKDYNAAPGYFTTALEGGLAPEDAATAHFLLARSYDLLARKDPSKAPLASREYYTFVIQFPHHPSVEDALYFWYRLPVPETTDMSARRETLRTALLSSAKFREIILSDLGTVFLKAGDSSRAKAAAFEFLRSFPASEHRSRVFNILGGIYSVINRDDSSEVFWKQAASTPAVDPSVAEALWNLAELYWNTGRPGDAVTPLKRLVDEFSYTSLAGKAAGRLPEAFASAGKYDEAVDAYRALVHNGNPDQDDEPEYSVDTKIAQMYEKKNNHTEAIHYYREYLAQNRKGALAGSVFYSLGGIAKAMGNAGLASSYFRQAAAVGGQATVSAEIADLLFQSEQYGEAAVQYAQLSKRTANTDSSRSFATRAIISMLRLDKLQDSQKMIAAFDDSFKDAKAERGEIEYEKGLYYYRMQEYASAKKAFENVSGEFSETKSGVWGKYYLGKIAEVTDKLEDAAKIYEDLLSKSPDADVTPRILLSLGNMHFNAERFEEAIKFYKEILQSPHRSDDVLPYAMNNLIEAYESLKLYDAALKTTRDFIERYPNDENILDKKIKIGSLYTRVGYYDQAVQQFQTLLNEGESSLEAELRYDIGEAYFSKGDYQQAILEFLKVPYLVAKQGKVNWTATSLYMAGQAYEKMSKPDEALGMYQQIIERPGIDATFKAAARKEIDRVKGMMKKGSR